MHAWLCSDLGCVNSQSSCVVVKEMTPYVLLLHDMLFSPSMTISYTCTWVNKCNQHALNSELTISYTCTWVNKCNQHALNSELHLLTHVYDIVILGEKSMSWSSSTYGVISFTTTQLLWLFTQLSNCAYYPGVKPAKTLSFCVGVWLCNTST